MRHSWRFQLLLLVGCVVAMRSHGQGLDSIGQTAPVMAVHGDEDGEPATPFTQILEDKAGTLDLDAVRATKAGWHPGAHQDALTFGFSRSVYWVRLLVENSSSRRVPLILDLGNPRQDYVHWYVLKNDGQFKTETTSGDRLPYSQRQIKVRNFAASLALDPKERAEIVIRLQSHDGLFEAMPLQVSRSDKFLASSAAENQLLAIYHGGIAALALYNLLLYFALGERTFGSYVLYLAFFSASSFTFRGLSFQYFWPQSPAFNNDILTTFTACTFATFGMFAISYLRMRETTPRWVWRLNQSFVLLNLLVVVPAMLGYYALGAGLGELTGICAAVISIGTGIWLLHRGSRQARFFVIAFAIVGVGAVVYMLQIIAVAPTNWFTTWGIQIGSAIEVLLLALGLADSMNELKAQKLDAERKAREAQEALNAQLAQQVNERTEALELANRRLHDLAITDELTGAFNRSHYSAFCSAALTHRERDEPLAFCMFDIDHFKSYNEKYGLEAGNGVLRRVAQAVRGELRRSGDVLFRLGGEEFGILFTSQTAETAKQFVDRLRVAVRNLAIAHEGSNDGVLTASFGIGWWDKSVTYRLTPNQIYAVADNMLYEAKEAGRDRVSMESHTAPTDPAVGQQVA